MEAEGGGKDFTDEIRESQQGNHLMMGMSGEGKVTVYYKYGKGKMQSKDEAEDGKIFILPPTKLRVDYTINGLGMSKTVDINQLLKVNIKGK